MDVSRVYFAFAIDMRTSGFKAITIEHLRLSSDLCIKRWGGAHWKKLVRILFVYASSSCPVPIDTVSRIIGHKVNTTLYMMVESGWLNVSGWKKHFVLSAKSKKLVDELIKRADEQYSTFYCEQLELKKSRMGDLWEDEEIKIPRKRKNKIS